MAWHSTTGIMRFPGAFIQLLLAKDLLSLRTTAPQRADKVAVVQERLGAGKSYTHAIFTNLYRIVNPSKIELVLKSRPCSSSANP
jgi:hypothetical protein